VQQARAASFFTITTRWQFPPSAHGGGATHQNLDSGIVSGYAVVFNRKLHGTSIQQSHSALTIEQLRSVELDARFAARDI
jgi:hypothetical protein